MTRSPFQATIIFLCLLVSAVAVHAQDNWDAYVARYDAGPGSVLVNMSAAHQAPKRDMPFLLITGVSCRTCTGDGFPTPREYKRLYRLSEEVNRQLFKWSASNPNSKAETSDRDETRRKYPMLVGTFTHQCQRLDYVYLADTTGVRAALGNWYVKHYGRYNFYIQLQEDPEWEAYRMFLYPNESVRTFMMNNRAITHMTDAGDALSRPRFVEHLIYFDTIEDRELFIRYLGGTKYDIKDEREMHRDSLRYQVRLARFGTVSLDEMNNQTTYLSTTAREFNGVYDGWITKLIGTKQRFRLLYNPIAEPINTAK